MHLKFLAFVAIVAVHTPVLAAEPGDACTTVDEDICSEDGTAILRCGDNLEYFQWANTTSDAVWGSGRHVRREHESR